MNTNIVDKSYVSLFERSIKLNWDKSALSDYKMTTLRYQDIARYIEYIHIVFEEGGIKPGDKVAICGKNCAHWAITFLATITYGAVAVPILHEFKPEQVANILSHSDAKILAIGDREWKLLQTKLSDLPQLVGVFSLTDYSLLHSVSDELTFARGHMLELFGRKYPDNFTPNDICYLKQDGDALALINYTSGSTGKSKGVMLPYRAIWSNVQFVIDEVGDAISKEGTVLSILPLAHMYGLAFELLSPMALGMHTTFLIRMSPTTIFKAFSEIRPTFIVSVPLIIEKFMRRGVIPTMEKKKIRMLLKLPILQQKVIERINQRIRDAFGGRFYEVIIGGAAFNHDIEALLTKIGFNYTVGYGATECAPLITYIDWKNFIPGSCGVHVPRTDVRILNPDETGVGEIICRGDNVMLGYFKNEEETAKAIDADGWYHTGDLGTMDLAGNLYISGRIKNMLLGPNGQNIFPEEIEDKLNATPLISESVVIQKDGKLYGLIYLDNDIITLRGLTDQQILTQALEDIRKEVNEELPAYEQIVAFKIHNTEFEKTPKKSIKRFLYFDENIEE